MKSYKTLVGIVTTVALVYGAAGCSYDSDFDRRKKPETLYVNSVIENADNTLANEIEPIGPNPDLDDLITKYDKSINQVKDLNKKLLGALEEYESNAGIEGVEIADEYNTLKSDLEKLTNLINNYSIDKKLSDIKFENLTYDTSKLENQYNEIKDVVKGILLNPQIRNDGYFEANGDVDFNDIDSITNLIESYFSYDENSNLILNPNYVNEFHDGIRKGEANILIDKYANLEKITEVETGVSPYTELDENGLSYLDKLKGFFDDLYDRITDVYDRAVDEIKRRKDKEDDDDKPYVPPGGNPPDEPVVDPEDPVDPYVPPGDGEEPDPEDPEDPYVPPGDGEEP